MTPALQLLYSSSAEGISCGKDYGIALFLQPMGQFGRRCSLTDAIDANDEDHAGLPILAFGGQGITRGKALVDVGAGDVDDVLSGDFATEFFEFVDDLHRSAHSEVGGNEFGLDLIPFDLSAVGDFIEK